MGSGKGPDGLRMGQGGDVRGLALTYISQNIFQNIPCLLRKEKFPEIFPVWVLEGTPLDPSGDPQGPVFNSDKVLTKVY